MSQTPDLSLVILTYNSQYWLKKTLQTLDEHYLQKTKYRVEVIVVDNYSQDETLEVLESDFPWVKVIESPENGGFAKGNNLALKTITSPFVMLFNSDMECTRESNFDELLEYLQAHEEVGVITPKVQLMDGQLDLACHRGEPTLWASLTYFTKLERIFPYLKHFSQYHQLYKNLNQVHEIDACSGAAMMIRTAAMKKVGLLDEQFFMYAEDLDWCKRFREAGYQVIYYPYVTVIHHKYKSGISSLSSQIASKTKVYFYETMLQYYDKHYQTRYPKWVRQLIYLFLELKKGAV